MSKRKVKEKASSLLQTEFLSLRSCKGWFGNPIPFSQNEFISDSLDYSSDRGICLKRLQDF